MKRLIFDCDNTFGINGCDFDDGLALLYLLGNSEAVDYIVQAVKNAEDNIYILATGSLTNIRQAYRIDNTLFEKVSGRESLNKGFLYSSEIKHVNVNLPEIKDVQKFYRTCL